MIESFLAFGAKYNFSFSTSSVLTDLSFDHMYRRKFQDSPFGSKKNTW